MNQKTNIPLASVLELLPQAVLLPIERGRKGPRFKNWERTTRDSMKLPAYLSLLKSHSNTGILVGKPSGNLITIDFDVDADAREFFRHNPRLWHNTLVTRGKRGCNCWLQMVGPYPQRCITVPDRGEWRGGGVQTVIRGIHPEGGFYTWLCDRPPIKLRFTDLRLPGWLTSAISAVPESSRHVQRQLTAGHTSTVVGFIRDHALEICQCYLPLGHRCGSEWLIGDLCGSAGRSCHVQLTGEHAGLAYDFNGHQGASLLQVIANALGITQAKAAHRIQLEFGLLPEAPQYDVRQTQEVST